MLRPQVFLSTPVCRRSDCLRMTLWRALHIQGVCVCIYIYRYKYTHYTYMHTCIQTYIRYLHTYIHTYIHTCIRTCIHVHIHLPIHMHTCVYYVSIHVYIYISLYMGVPENRGNIRYSCLNIDHPISAAGLHRAKIRVWRRHQSCLLVGKIKM